MYDARQTTKLSILQEDRVYRRFCKKTRCIVDSAIRQAEVQPGGHGAFPLQQGCAPFLHPRLRLLEPAGVEAEYFGAEYFGACVNRCLAMLKELELHGAPILASMHRWPRVQSPWCRRTLWPAHEHVWVVELSLMPSSMHDVIAPIERRPITVSNKYFREKKIAIVFLRTRYY